MLRQINRLIRALGEAAIAVQENRRRRSEWRFEGTVGRSVESPGQDGEREVPRVL